MHTNINSKKNLISIFTFFIILCILFDLIPLFKAEAITFTPPFDINSESAVLINLDTNSVVFEKNPDKQQMPAQLTNIMTAIICLENCRDIKIQKLLRTTIVWRYIQYEYPNDIRLVIYTMVMF